MHGFHAYNTNASAMTCFWVPIHGFFFCSFVMEPPKCFPGVSGHRDLILLEPHSARDTRVMLLLLRTAGAVPVVPGIEPMSEALQACALTTVPPSITTLFHSVALHLL